MVGALSQSIVEPWLGASVAQPGRCFSTPESIRLVSGKARLSCPAGSRVQTPPEAPKHNSSILPEKPLMRRGTIIAIWVFFLPRLTFVWLDYGLVSGRWACYQLLWLFSIGADSPRDKRENHVLEIAGSES